MLAAALGGCTSVAIDRGTFEGTRWHVTAVNGQPTPSAADYRLEFTAGRIGGRFGCNSFGGPYAITGETITAGPLAATRMACADPAGSIESAGFAVLAQPMRWTWTAGLKVTLSNGAGTVALERAP